MRIIHRIWAVPLARHVIVAAIGLVIVTAVLESSSPFRNSQFSVMAYMAIAAGGLTVLTGLNGQLSLGHGAFMAFGAYTTALLLGDPDGAGMPLVVVLIVSALVALAVGAIVGIPAARLHGPYIAGATLALAVAVPGIAIFFDRLGGEEGLSVYVPDIPEWVLDASFFITGNELDRTRYLAYVGWLCLAISFVFLANLSRSRVGRAWRAVRDDDVAAELAGIHLARTRVLAFTVSTTCAGLGGALLAMNTRLTAPSGFTITESITLLSVVVLGGLGSLTGALVGSALITFLPQLVTQWGEGRGLESERAAEISPVVLGATMMLVIVLAPAGIVGTLQRARARRRTTPLPSTPLDKE